MYNNVYRNNDLYFFTIWIILPDIFTIYQYKMKIYTIFICALTCTEYALFECSYVIHGLNAGNSTPGNTCNACVILCHRTTSLFSAILYFG